MRRKLAELIVGERLYNRAEVNEIAAAAIREYKQDTVPLIVKAAITRMQEREKEERRAKYQAEKDRINARRRRQYAERKARKGREGQETSSDPS